MAISKMGTKKYLSFDLLKNFTTDSREFLASKFVKNRGVQARAKICSHFKVGVSIFYRFFLAWSVDLKIGRVSVFKVNIYSNIMKR